MAQESLRVRVSSALSLHTKLYPMRFFGTPLPRSPRFLARIFMHGGYSLHAVPALPFRPFISLVSPRFAGPSMDSRKTASIARPRD